MSYLRLLERACIHDIYAEIINRRRCYSISDLTAYIAEYLFLIEDKYPSKIIVNSVLSILALELNTRFNGYTINSLALNQISNTLKSLGPDIIAKNHVSKLFRTIQNKSAVRIINNNSYIKGNNFTYEQVMEKIDLDESGLQDFIYFDDNGLLTLISSDIVERVDNIDIDELSFIYINDNEGASYDVNDGIYTCADCGTIYHTYCTESYTVLDSTDDKIDVCSNCSSEYRYCINADYLIHHESENIYYSEIDGEYYYFDCTTELYTYLSENNAVIDDSSGNIVEKTISIINEFDKYEIHSYGTEVPTGELKDDIIYYGVELEVELKDNEECDIYDCHKNFVDNYSKTHEVDFLSCHDGSLNDGFEIISVPMEYDEISNYLQRVSNALRGTNLVSYSRETTGFHVHISKKPLSDDVIAFLYLFLNRSQNSKLLQKIGNREFNSYCSTQRADIDIIPRSDLIDKYTYIKTMDRYTVLNISNKNTIEFRFFKGTYKLETMKSYVEFINLLIDYAKNEVLKDNINFTIESFFLWIQLNNREHECPNLFNRLDEYMIANNMKLECQLTLSLV
jgi:hypothetical protein